MLKGEERFRSIEDPHSLHNKSKEQTQRRRHNSQGLAVIEAREEKHQPKVVPTCMIDILPIKKRIKN